MPTYRRISLVVAVVALATASFSIEQALAGRIEIRQIDTRAYPTIRVLVVAPTATRTAPTLRDGGAPAVDLSAQSLANRDSIALLIDNSQSMRGRPLADAIRAAHAFVAAKPSPDRISVIAVGSQAVTYSGFSAASSDSDAVLHHLSIDVRKGTVLWDAIALAANALGKNGLLGRVIILVTDGQNTTSKTTVQDAIRAARSAGAAIYTIGIPDKWFTPQPLQQLAKATGGRFYPAPTTASLPAIYHAIGAELSRSWQLNFVTAARPGERLQLEAEAAGASTAATTAPPRNLAGKPGSGSQLILISVALLLAVGLAFGLLFTLRSATLPHWWRGQPPDF